MKMVITRGELLRGLAVLAALGGSFWLKLEWLAVWAMIYSLCSIYLTLEEATDDE